jgi:serine/threonine protein kinase
VCENYDNVFYSKNSPLICTFDAFCCHFVLLCPAKYVKAEDAATYMELEGKVNAVLQSRPHENIHRLTASLDDSNGAGLLISGPLGIDLHSYVRAHKRLPEPEAREIFRQLASAVAHCHRNNVVLRDLKLGKIFFKRGSQKHIVVADLDGAQVISEHEPLLRDQKGYVRMFHGVTLG